MKLDALLDTMSHRLFGRTASDAREQFICVRDGETMEGRLTTRAAWHEYAQTALCLSCVDEIFDVGEEVEPMVKTEPCARHEWRHCRGDDPFYAGDGSYPDEWWQCVRCNDVSSERPEEDCAND